MRVHVIQVSYGDEESLSERTERVAALVRDQRGADLVVLPELWPNGGFAYDGWEDSAQPLDGPVVTALRAAAGDLGATVHMGSLVERDGTGRLFNTSVLIGPDGEVLTTYRKIHLFGFGEGEPKLMTPGSDVVVHDGLGLATCYDLRFPEMFRALLDGGAEVNLVPAAWPAKRVHHWRLLAQARAVENQSYVVACNTAGTHAGVPMGGGSLVVDPWGEVIAEGGTEEEVLVVDVDLDLVRSTRASFPVLRDRRLDAR
ncbi:MAG: carbon-nitrogen family hydrolase [Spirochaetaceae bacterium]|nr:carbon-nitrogen family hydrolase [Spirochaetaceae bacterium]